MSDFLYLSEKKRLDLSGRLAFVVVGKEFCQVCLVHVGSYFFQGVFLPKVRIYAECGARYHEGVEDGVVLGAAVVLAEKIVFMLRNPTP